MSKIEALQRLPFLGHLSTDERRQLEQDTFERHYERGAMLLDNHSECLGMVIVASGRLRTVMQSIDGREVTLYSLEPGDVDPLTASCVITQLTFDTSLVADASSTVFVIPSRTLKRLEQQNIYVHSYVYELTAARFSDAMWALQQVLFLTAEQRVANGLLDEYARTNDPHIHLTQEQIAKNISSAREVVSRSLKRMEQDGVIKMNRGCIQLLDYSALNALAG
jgi:CRP/FNR family transcriptional regulator